MARGLLCARLYDMVLLITPSPVLYASHGYLFENFLKVTVILKTEITYLVDF